jgi:hypothetical protein
MPVATVEEPYNERRREWCQSISEAGSVIGALGRIWDNWFPAHDFTEAMFKPLWDENTSGRKQLDALARFENDPETEWAPGEPLTTDGREAIMKIMVMAVSCAYCIQALREKKNSTRAWSYVADANQWLGVLQGLITGLDSRLKLSASELGRKGAAAAHAENRAMKAIVLEWCDKNMPLHKSMDAAAEAIAGKLVPVKFRTAREWIGEWKKLRSGGAP